MSSKHSHHRNNNWHNNQSDNKEQRHDNQRNFHANKQVSYQQMKAEEEAINAYKNSNANICPFCNKVITDISSAITDKASGNPVHFDCMLEQISKNEKLDAGDKLTYIGQGRFGILNFSNVHDMKHFTIKKIIDIENTESHAEWRNEISDLYSQIR